jgi:hypothetical protein
VSRWNAIFKVRELPGVLGEQPQDRNQLRQQHEVDAPHRRVFRVGVGRSERLHMRGIAATRLLLLQSKSLRVTGIRFLSVETRRPQKFSSTLRHQGKRCVETKEGTRHFPLPHSNVGAKRFQSADLALPIVTFNLVGVSKLTNLIGLSKLTAQMQRASLGWLEITLQRSPLAQPARPFCRRNEWLFSKLKSVPCSCISKPSID